MKARKGKGAEFMSTHHRRPVGGEKISHWTNEIILNYPPIKTRLLVSPVGLEPTAIP